MELFSIGLEDVMAAEQLLWFCPKCKDGIGYTLRSSCNEDHAHKDHNGKTTTYCVQSTMENRPITSFSSSKSRSYGLGSMLAR